jgi:hypothetical protein
MMGSAPRADNDQLRELLILLARLLLGLGPQARDGLFAPPVRIGGGQLSPVLQLLARDNIPFPRSRLFDVLCRRLLRLRVFKQRDGVFVENTLEPRGNAAPVGGHALHNPQLRGPQTSGDRLEGSHPFFLRFDLRAPPLLTTDAAIEY